MGFIIIVAGRAFSDATGMRLRSQNMLNSAEEAGRISALLKEDVSQMGTKSWGASSASGYVIDTVAAVHMKFPNKEDLSSYYLHRPPFISSASGYDSLYFLKAYYDENGVCRAVMQVEWYVRADSVLMRKCSTINNPKCTGASNPASECPATPVEMAKNVAQFRLLPSKPGAVAGSSASSAELFPSSGSSFALINPLGSSYQGPRATLGPFPQNSSSGGTLHTNYYLAAQGQSDCQDFEFSDGEEYAISFHLPYAVNTNDPCKAGGNKCTGTGSRYNKIAMFQAERDHLSAGLRDVNMNGEPIVLNGVRLPDFLFYPPQGTDASMIRHFEFSVPGNVRACVGITAAFYGPAAEGHLDIENFRVYRKTDKVYHFERNVPGYNPDYNSTPYDKASVKAFELTLGINKKGEINRVATVIPVPNNGVVPPSGGN